MSKQPDPQAAAKETHSPGSRRSPTSERDYVAIAYAYAQAVIADKQRKRHCQKERLACLRFINDLKRIARAKSPPFEFSPTQANRYCAFIENLPHVEGRWDTETITMHPTHVFMVVNLFGFRLPDGRRRFTSALLAVARKNAKSTIAAAILLACYCLEDELGPQVISAATTGQQARIIFNYAKRMVEKTSDLRDEFDVETFAHSIVRYESQGVFKPINAKASTQDGLNPSHISLDEIHAHKTHDLWNVLRSAAGGRRSPLYLFTTTEGYENAGPWPEIRALAGSILKGTVEADHYFVLYFELDEEDDDFDESKWQKANPLMSVNPALLSALRKEALEAKQMPSARGEFRIKRLNRPSTAARAWVNLANWDKCGGPVDLKMLLAKRARCFAAFDLASTTDMVAWRLLWELQGHYYTWGRYWVPSAASKQRTERNSAAYDGWIEAGLIEQIEGETVDYEVIQKEILDDIHLFNPIQIGFDPWNAMSVVNFLENQGVPLASADNARGLISFTQGPKSYNAAMNAFEMAYSNGRLSHEGNRVLRWNAANLVARLDVNLNKAPDRKKSADKIDGIVALIMAMGLEDAEAKLPKPRIRSL